MGRKYGGWLGWDELITHQRVVLLAEAKSGKTEEFLLRARALRDQGKPSFFVRIEDLADGPLVTALTAEDEEQFKDWRAGKEPGWFFLDSVDEARLNTRSFERALRQFRRDLGNALDRASVFISCRASDWRGHHDSNLVISELPPSLTNSLDAKPSSLDDLLLGPIFKDDSLQESDASSSAKKESITIVRLADLNTAQRSALARWAGIAETDLFIREINRHGLATLTERPGDLLELAAYWKAYGKFASFAEMTEFAIGQKLAERDPHRPDASTLNESRIREGSERIAAALTLGKSLTLRIPGQEADPSLATGALDAADILPDWT